MPYESLFSTCLSGLSHSLLHIRKQTTAMQLVACRPLRSPGSVLRRRRPLWAGNKPCLPLSASLSGEFLALAPQNLQGIDKPFNEAHQAVCRLSP